MQIRNRFVVVTLCASLLVLSNGCNTKPVPNGGLFPIVLQTDWYPQPEMGGFYQAQLQGLYKEEGLDVTIAPGGPFVTAEQQVATGAAQFAMGSSDQVLVKVSRGLPLIAVAATMQQDPQAIMLHANSPVKDFPDLEGHQVAIKPGSIWFQYLLHRYHFNSVREIPATYSVANFLQDPDYIQQCFVTSEPYFARKGGAAVRTLLISSTGYQPYRVYFTSTKFLSEHPDIIAKFVKASTQGWKNYLADPSMTDAAIGKLNPAMSPEQMAFSVRTLQAQHFIDGDGNAESHLGHFTDARWASTYQQLVALKVTDKAIDPKTAYTMQFAP